ncbi:unnamed protein product [Cyprideis torosa]|uniref:Uncharacterized protein n=1 Tax=Cyprideis torosa TaxID=163714 RepID=A0A7R8WU59_9CRUS|nr:unnamed protein product [Cyprideis torosa]CAG0906484.1 unnamed protein product [Cyprideis torosa]
MELITDWIRAAVEGATVDGRTITGEQLEQMAAAYDPDIYNARIWKEHVRGITSESQFKPLGNVVATRSEAIRSGALTGKTALFVKIAPAPELITLVRAGHHMNNETRLQFNALTRSICQVFGIDDPSRKFTIAPTPVQGMVELIQEEASFLKNINIIPVSAQVGQKLGLGIGSPVASRTNTDNEDRETRYVGELKGDEYHCMQTNFDTHLNYAVLDSWAHLTRDDFRRMYSRAVLKRMALDRIMIGWNGSSAAETTDRAANPLLQDVNVGWLEKVRLKAPSKLMGYDTSGVATDKTYRIGEGGEYGTLDALVFDIISNLLDPWYQNGEDLVLILGRELWVNHGLTLYNDNRAATERNALQTWFAREAIAGLPTVTVPYFPARGLVVTSYDNLSLYYQEGKTRRAIIDNPKRDRVEEYLSSNDAYVVEDYGKIGGIRPGAVLLKNAAAVHYAAHFATRQDQATQPGTQSTAATVPETPQHRETRHFNQAQKAKFDVDKAQLSRIRSVKRRIEAKRERLTSYMDYIQLVLNQDSGGNDDIFVTLLIWCLDVGEYRTALLMIRYALKHRLAAPEGYTRSLPEVIAEEFADFVIKSEQPEQFTEHLEQLHSLLSGQDMFDQVTAKFYKAWGLSLEQNQPQQALKYYRLALVHNSGLTIKRRIKRLEKQLMSEGEADGTRHLDD